MSNIKFVQDVFLEKEELNRFKKFITTNGYCFDFLASTKEYGIIQNSKLDPNFDFFRVSLGSTNNVRVEYGFAYDSERLTMHRNAIADEIFIPTNQWYWLAISHKYNPQEVGTVSIGGVNKGLMTAIDATNFKEVLRGGPNFPSKVKFINSVRYQQEYEVLDVIDNNNAVLQGNFDYVETNLQYAVVGTFTAGYYPPNADKLIFQYDDCNVDLIAETTLNTPPTIIDGKQFLIARVYNDGTNIQIIDYRANNVCRNKLESSLASMDNLNPLIAIQYVKKVQIGGRYFYNVSLDWKFVIESENQTSQNSTVNIALGKGGAFKAASDFTTGDFDGWRYYYDDGDYSTIIQSLKTGTSFSIKLDAIKPNHAGAFICPPYEQIELQYQFLRGNGVAYHKDVKIFDITSEDPILAFTQDLILNNNQVVKIKYKYKNLNRKGIYTGLNSNTYYKDTAFNANGDLIDLTATITSDQAILGISAVQSYLNVPKFVPLPFDPPDGFDMDLNFDDTGLGIAGEFIGWAQCNGNNGTRDWAGITPIGATRIDNTHDLPRVGAPPMLPDAINNPVDLAALVGNAVNTISKANLPDYDLSVNDPGHKHVFKFNSDQGGSSFGNDWMKKDGSNEGKDTETAVTGITVSLGGSSDPLSNRQNSRGVIWICRIV